MYSWRALLYRLLIMVAGWGWLLWTCLHPHEPLPWGTVGIFVVLSWLVKRAGFRIIAEVTHSLVNVVDVGALLLLGPLGGAIVGSLSSVFHVQFSLIRRGTWRGREFFDLPLFDGAVKAILALAGGAFYLESGGVLAPTTLSPTLLLPLLLLYLSWFALDHLLWSWLFLVSGGIERARAFILRISTVSLLIELAPLPFSIAFAVAWTLFDPLLRLLLLVGTVLVALVVRGLAIAFRRAEERVSTVSLLNKFGQALVLAQLDERKLADLLYEYAAALLPNARFELILIEEGSDSPCCAIMPQPEMESRVEALAPMILPLLQERPRGRLLSTLSPDTLMREMQRAPEERPTRGGALLMPLIAHDELLGLFVAESLTPNALTLDDGRSLSVLATQAAVVLQNARQFNREQRHVRQLQALGEVSRLVASVIKLDDLLWQVADLLQDTFGYYHVQIYLVEPGNTEIDYRAGSGAAGRELAQRKMSLRVGEGIIGWVAERGTPLLVRDVSKDPRYLPNRFRLLSDTQSEVALPLKVEERVLGVLDVQSNQLNGLDPDDLFTLSTLADQLAIAIEDARLYVAQRESAWVTRGLLQIAEAMNPLFELSAVLDTITRIVPPLVGMDAAAIYLWRSEDQLFEGAISYGLPDGAERALRHHRFAPEAFSLLENIRDQQQLVLIERVDPSVRLPTPLTEAIAEMGLIAAPLQAQGSLIGVMLLAAREGLPPLSNRRKTLIAGVAQQAAVAIQAATLYAAQQEEAAITSDLLQVAEMVASRSDLQEILELVTRLTVTLASVEHCVVYLWDEGKQALLPAEAYGFPPAIEAAWRETVLPAHELGALVVLWDSHEPTVLGEGGEHPLGCEALLALFEAETLVATPLRAREEFLGLLFVNLNRTPPRLTKALRDVLMGIARQLSVALENSMLYKEALENERRGQELVLARQIQSSLLPEKAPELPGYDIAGYWRPAREVAGDFYDFLHLSQGRLAFSIADVADKGMGAALFMVLTRTALRESLWSEEDAGRALTRMNALIAADVRGGMFLTIFLGILSPESGRLQAANAGHLPPLLYRADSDSLSSTVRRNMPVGILPDTHYDTIDLVLEMGDLMVLITDGIMDTMNPAGELYGLQRLSALVYEHRHKDAHALVTTILDAALAHAEGQPFDDDLTIIVLRRSG